MSAQPACLGQPRRAAAAVGRARASALLSRLRCPPTSHRAATRRRRIEMVCPGADQINSFLQEAGETLKKFQSASDASALTIVLGNEACDLDSMVSALSLAMLLRCQGKEEAVPVFNIPRADFALRTESVFLFGDLGVDVGSAIFIDDLDLAAIVDKAGRGAVEVALVDHNRLAAHQQVLQDYISRIVDHHDNENLYHVENQMRDVRPVGSCATMVAEAIAQWESDQANATPLSLLKNEALTKLLSAAVLIDTSNLDAKVGRCLPEDVAVIKLLNGKVKSTELTQLYETLKDAKFDQSSLSSRDLLRKDYKEWVLNGTRVGISSVGISLTEWCAKEDAIGDDWEAWRLERQCDILLVMASFFTDGDTFNRQLAALGEKEATAALMDFMCLPENDLQLSPCLVHDGIPYSFVQGNVRLSRKKVQPLVAQCLTAAP
mmetsp:Transcript_12144/g.44303  ORF Transcript_12144/g.44303 Transcript_12144/m.44303 type:complete len:434 (-) Transcript_12144:95-1396(-)